MKEVIEVKGLTNKYYKFRVLIALVKSLFAILFIYCPFFLPALGAYILNQQLEILSLYFISTTIYFTIVGLIFGICFPIYLIWLRNYIKTYEWKINESEIVLKQGVFIRVESRIPFSNIQNVGLLQHFWERKFGWYNACIQTSEVQIGTKSADRCIIGLRNATLIQSEIIRRANRFLNTRTTSVEEIISRLSENENLLAEGIKFYDFKEQIDKIILILGDISRTLKKNNLKI